MTSFTGVKQYIKSNSVADISRKVLYYLLMKATKVNNVGRRIRFYFFTKCWIATISKGVVIHGFTKYMKIGINSAIYANAIFEFGPFGKLQIGNNFICSYGTLIACNGDIIIGDDVMIGEYSSVRDSTHLYDKPGVSFSRNGDYYGKISIGNNVWIGRGCIILPDTEIGSGVIIASNSVVKGKLNANSIYGGSPARFIKDVQQGTADAIA